MMMKPIFALWMGIFAFGAGGAHGQLKPEPENVRVVGSSTVAPFLLGIGTQIKDRARLYVSETGTGTGLSALCEEGDNGIDLVGASRAIRADELSRCAAVGVGGIVEFTLGSDGIVFAQSEKSGELALSSRDIYLAVAQNIPRSGRECVMVTNRRKYWNEVRSDLPHRPILILGPPTGSGTRDMFVDIVMREGARSFQCLADLEDRSTAFFNAAVDLRADGVWVDGGENDHAIAHTLIYLEEAIGVFGFSHLRETPGIVAISMDGTVPTPDTIRTGDYRITRPLFLYATAERLRQRSIVGWTMSRFSAPGAMSASGLLSGLGLVISEQTGDVVLLDTATGARDAVENGMKAFLSPPS